MGYTEKPLIVMGQQASMGENGYFPTVNGGSLQYRVRTKSAKVCEIYMETPFMVLCERVLFCGTMC
jgi:hypothetical protein